MSDFLDRMKNAAKADKKTVVLPEGEDPRTIAAARKIVDEGLANLVVLGDPATIDLPGVAVIDPKTSDKHNNASQASLVSPVSSSACASGDIKKTASAVDNAKIRFNI